VIDKVFDPAVDAGVVIVNDVDVLVPRVTVVPPNVAAVTVSKLVPVITVTVPPATGPDVTESDVIIGAGTYVYAAADVALGPGVLTTMSFAPTDPAGVRTVTDPVFGNEVI
jgi:hypothetical protein